ncbi:response regulator [Azospirillum picis]|uniref:histidine kinase n=1 Tax=Azospirillum picis TaxID=488438 RepID=A0ABU0ML02_9PROT|nr:response regulator [Azospirillum picis]MBP2300230.1 PAS domain S-box-containing protein [Azospirillum picis]MDQ0533928.1 PAS domain S-box-containing protein [Azospirillum picis]
MTRHPIDSVGPTLSPMRTRRLLVAAFALIAVLGSGFWGVVAWSDRTETLRHSREQAQSTARLLQEHVRRTVATADLAIGRTLDLVHSQGLAGLGTNRNVWIPIRDMVDALPEIAALWVHGATGDNLLSSRQFPAPAGNVMDRAFFQAHLNGVDFHVGERITGRLTGAQLFTVSRPILADGQLQGVVHANVEIDYYRQLYESLDLGPGSAIALYRNDGKPVLRFPDGEPLDGPDGREALRRSADAAIGTFEGDGPQGRRIVSYQRVPTLPLVVLVGLSEKAELAAWRERTLRGSILVALAVAACGGLAYATLRSLEREVAGRRRLAETNGELDAKQRELETANEAFASANRRLTLILRSASDSICGVDRDGRITFANPATSALTGYADHELLGGCLHALVHSRRADGSPYPARECPVTEVLLSGETRRGLDDTYWTKDGRPIAVEYTASPMLADGKVEGAVVVFHEIAERKRAEAAMQRARLAAEAASRAKSEFLANMSHEIRTPMNAILGLIHLLQQTDLTQRQSDYVRKVRLSAQSLLGILNDILDFSKVEAGKLELERVDFRLDDLLQTLAVVVGSAAQEKDIDVLFSVAPDVPLDLVGDPLRLQQILINLAGNAVKFTDAGEVVVSARVRSLGDDRAVLDFAVRDTGIGIAPDQRERLFQAFSQGDSSTTRRFGGTGLGLAICARLVRLMGGAMEVESEPGQGSVFRFHAEFGRGPGRGAGELPPQAGLSHPDAQPHSQPLPRDLSVLVVDDNTTAREVLGEIAATFGWAVTVCRDGQAAIDELERAAAAGRAHDVVLMDWKMPGMDGIEAARRIRADERVGTPMIIVISGYGRERLGTRFEEAGVAGFLVKPVTASTLLDAVTVAYAHAGPDGRGDEGDGPPPDPAPRPADRAVAGDAGQGEARSPGRAPDQPLQGCRLLLADDNAISQEVAREILERAGAVVTVAATGRQAVDCVRFAERPFDAALLDVHMPDLDGFEATAAIRALPEGGRLPIIAMTASALPADRRRCLDNGMDDHIPKPLDLPQLFATLARWIGPPPARPASGPAAPAGSLVAVPAAHPAAAIRHDGLNHGGLNLDGVGRELPDMLPGIDMSDALGRLDGDGALLRRLLEQFADGYADAAERIAAAQASGDLPGVKAVAHELKSVAGNVGARRLSATADTVQIAADGGDSSVVGMQVEVLRRELALVLESVRILAGDAVRPGGGVADRAPSEQGRRLLAERLPHFAALLQDSNFAAAEEFAILAPSLAEWIEPSRMKGLSAAIDGLDFNKALGIVQRIARDLGLSLPTV